MLVFEVVDQVAVEDVVLSLYGDFLYVKSWITGKHLKTCKFDYCYVLSRWAMYEHSGPAHHHHCCGCLAINPATTMA